MIPRLNKGKNVIPLDEFDKTCFSVNMEIPFGIRC